MIISCNIIQGRIPLILCSNEEIARQHADSRCFSWYVLVIPHVSISIQLSDIAADSNIARGIKDLLQLRRPSATQSSPPASTTQEQESIRYALPICYMCYLVLL